MVEVRSAGQDALLWHGLLQLPAALGCPQPEAAAAGATIRPENLASLPMQHSFHTHCSAEVAG